MIWLENIKQFFVDNATYILSFLTPANIIAAVATIVVAIRNGKATKNTTSVGTAMAEKADKISEVANAIEGNTNAVTQAVNRVDELEAKVKCVRDKIEIVESGINNKFDELEDKMNAILQVQSMVYNTIQDDALRTNVQNLIATAKMSSDHTREKLQAEIDALKNDVATKVGAIATAVNDGVKQIEDASKTVVAKKKSLRY